jgi:TRAP-type C4-dicarboxylate transport system permease small subunit
MSGAANGVERAEGLVEAALGIVAAIPGALELTEMMLAALIFAALPLATARREHILVDLVDAVTPRGLLRLQIRVVSLLSAGVLGLLAWRFWGKAAEMWSYRNVTDYYDLPLAPVAAFMALTTTLAAALFVAQALRPSERHETTL